MNIIRYGLESIRTELSFLDDYIDETAVTLTRKQKDIEQAYEKAKKEGSDDTGELDMYFSDEFHRYHELFPTFTYNSILVSQFSFFESRLKFLCELYDRNKFSNVKPSHLSGSDIEKYKRYLTVVAEINFDELQEKWKSITDIKKLRNAIVHNSAKIINEKGNDNIIRFINSDKRIEYKVKNGEFYINDVSFLKEFSKLLLDFFTLLVEKLAVTKVIARNTSTPYDNTAWGQEKTETLLKEIVHGLELLKDNEKRTDEFKDSDLKANIHGLFGSMAYDLTKLYSFFCDGEWNTKDRNIIMDKGIEGLEHLKKIYNHHP